MKAIKVRQGESLTFAFKYPNDADSVTFTVWDDEGTVIDVTETFTANVANFDIEAIIADVGTYNYGFTLNFASGNTNQLPDIKNCKGDCSFPEFIICEGVPEGS